MCENITFHFSQLTSSVKSLNSNIFLMLNLLLWLSFRFTFLPLFLVMFEEEEKKFMKFLHYFLSKT